MSSFVWTVVTLTSVGLVTWGIMRIKLREMTARADFYRGISSLWEAISHGNHAGTCVDEGLAYINSVASKRRRDYVRQEVYELLDRSYGYYLRMLHQKVNRYLARDDSHRDELIHDLFVQNGRWLEFDEEVCDWYGAAAFEPPKGGKYPNRVRWALLEQRDACEKRLADERLRHEERLREIEEERRRMIAIEHKYLGFWRSMARTVLGP